MTVYKGHLYIPNDSIKGTSIYQMTVYKGHLYIPNDCL